MSEQSTDLRETVRQRYAAAAAQVTEGGTACCGPAPAEVDENFGSTLYAADERDALPAEAVAASSAAATPSPSPDSAPVSASSTSAPAAASTSCSPPAASAPPARPTAWT